MYSKYYGFSHKPFELTPDPGVIFLSETHQEAISILRYGVLNHKGFLQLTGKVGTGKSTLLQGLIRSLESNVHFCYIPNPNFTVQEFYYFLGAKFGLDEFDNNKAKFILSFNRFLHKCKENNELVLLIIDEAQVLPLEVLEEIRLISNQEFYDVFGILSIFLVGQPELNDLLDHQKLLPLRNRIAVRFNIEPLTLEETTAYIQFRLLKAGRRTVLFSPNAFKEIHRATGGTPRTINILCDNALLAGFAEQRGIIDDKIIRECARELRQAENDLSVPQERLVETEARDDSPGTLQVTPEPRKKSAFRLPGKVALALAAILIFFVALTATTQYWGRIPGTAPAKAWFEKVSVQFEATILSPVKKLFMGGRDKGVESPTAIPPLPANTVESTGTAEITSLPENAVAPPEPAEEKISSVGFVPGKKKLQMKRLEKTLPEKLLFQKIPQKENHPAAPIISA